MSVEYDPNYPAANEWLDWFSVPSVPGWNDSDITQS